MDKGCYCFRHAEGTSETGAECVGVDLQGPGVAGVEEGRLSSLQVLMTTMTQQREHCRAVDSRMWKWGRDDREAREAGAGVTQVRGPDSETGSPKWDGKKTDILMRFHQRKMR